MILASTSPTSPAKKWRKWRWICLFPSMVFALILPSTTSLFGPEAFAALNIPFGNMSSFGTEPENGQDNGLPNSTPQDEAFTLPPDSNADGVPPGLPAEEEAGPAFDSPAQQDQDPAAPPDDSVHSQTSDGDSDTGSGLSAGPGKRGTAASFFNSGGWVGGVGGSDDIGTPPGDDVSAPGGSIVRDGLTLPEGDDTPAGDIPHDFDNGDEGPNLGLPDDGFPDLGAPDDSFLHHEDSSGPEIAASTPPEGDSPYQGPFDNGDLPDPTGPNDDSPRNDGPIVPAQTPVPEPASLAVVGAALALMRKIRKR